MPVSFTSGYPHETARSPLNGSITVTPTKTTTYRIIATNTANYNLADDTVRVTVNITHPHPIISLTASPTMILPGETATLNWNSTNANQVIIDSGIGDVALNGSYDVSPQTTTKYTISAYGLGGVNFAYITINVEETPSAPNSLTSEYIAGDIIKTQWVSPQEPVNEYRVYRRTSTTAYDGRFFSTATEQYEDSNVQPNTLYCYQVSAVNRSGESPVSNETCEMLNWGVNTEIFDTFRYSAPVSSVAVADFNGDGFEDLALGTAPTPKGKNSKGRISIYLGGGVARKAVTITGPDCGVGTSMVAADIDADGYADIITSDPKCNSTTYDGTIKSEAGIVYIFKGGPEILKTPAFSVTGTENFGAGNGYNYLSENFGASLAALDFNGDGYDDVAIGAPLAHGIPLIEWSRHRGKVYVLQGGPSIALMYRSALGTSANQSFGDTVNPAGDVNGDGFEDIAVWSSGDSTGKYDGADIIFGTNDPSLSWRTTGVYTSSYETNEDIMGFDYNGDGYSDIKASGRLYPGTQYFYANNGISVRAGPIRLNSIRRFLSGFSADYYATSLTVGSITV